MIKNRSFYDPCALFVLKYLNMWLFTWNAAALTHRSTLCSGWIFSMKLTTVQRINLLISLEYFSLMKEELIYECILVLFKISHR